MKTFISIIILGVSLSTTIAQKTVPFDIHSGYQSFAPLLTRVTYDEVTGQFIFTHFNTPVFSYVRGKGQNSISITCGVLNLNDTIKWEATDPYIYSGTDAGLNLHTISADTIPAGAASFHFDWDNATYWEQNPFYIPTVAGFYLYKCLYHGSHMRGCFSVLGTSTSLSKEVQKIEQIPMIYPNPAKNYVEVVLDNATKYVIEVLNANGETLKTERSEGVYTYRVDISDLASGNYYINVKYCACQKPKLGCIGANQKYKFIKQ